MLELPGFEITDLARVRARHARCDSLTLQVCDECGLPQYPSRSVCRNCLASALSWSAVPTIGRVIAIAAVHASLHKPFRELCPLRICSVVLDSDLRVLAYVADDNIRSGDLVDVCDHIIDKELCVLIAKQAERPDSGEKQ